MENLLKALQTSGIPVAYEVWPEKDTPEMPVMVYRTTAINPFYADDVMFFAKHAVQIDLYTAIKDPDTEKTLEKALADYTWTKSEEYIGSENCYRITYETEA